MSSWPWCGTRPRRRTEEPTILGRPVSVRQLAPAEAHELVAQGAALVDVREDGEWAMARIPEAIHAPMSRFMDHLAEVPKDRPVVVTCAVGGRSQQVAAWLAQQGYDVANMRGGLHAWHAAGLPVDG